MKKLLLTGAVACALMTSVIPAKTFAKKDIANFEALHGQCVYGKRDDPDHKGIQKACADADKLGKRLTAQGYCIYGHGVVGRSSKNKNHCYEMAY